MKLVWTKGPPTKPGRYWLRFRTLCPLHDRDIRNARCQCGFYDRVLVVTSACMFESSKAHCEVPVPVEPVGGLDLEMAGHVMRPKGPWIKKK